MADGDDRPDDPPRLPPGTVVLQVTPALDAGGVEQTTLDMARAIVEAGGRALVASAGGRLEGELKARGGELFRIGQLARKDPASLIAAGRALRRLIRREGVQIVHARSRAPAYPAWWAARREGVAFVTTYHGVYNARSPLKRWYNRVMARGDLVIANSEFTRDHILAEHRNIDPDRVVAIARGIDLKRFDPAAVYAGRVAQVRASWGLEAHDLRPIALLAGRLTAWKGQALLIEAARRLREVDRDPFHLILAGDDQGRSDYTDSLRAAIAEADLEDCARIVGHVSDMPAAYLACTVACAPSLEPEAFGRTAVEPQAMGRPVIAADHGATSETVEHGVTGWRVPPGDADAWAAALGAALTLPAPRRAQMGEAGRARVRRLYSLEAMTGATLSVYDRLLVARRARAADARPERILVIKLAALGDVVQAFPPFAQIRNAHPHAHITLLTTPPYAALAAASPYFDAIETDGRPKRAGATAAMLRRLRRARYDRIYDLQTSTRSSAYFLALWPKPPKWSGIAPLASHTHADRGRDRMHTLERQADQLKDAGIWPDAPVVRGTAPAPDLSFMLADETRERRPEHFGLAAPYALLIPGASAHRPGKRWPAEAYAVLARRLVQQGMAVVVIGGPAEAQIGEQIVAQAGDGVFDLAGKTDYAQIAGLAARAKLAVGNDTGPTHLVAATGVPTLVLFSGESDPALCAPRGRRVEVLQADRLADLSVATVAESVAGLLSEP